MAAGSLTVVGTGIEFVVHLTPQALGEIRVAEDVPYLVADPASAGWLQSLNPAARSLHELYQPTTNRATSYEAIVDELLSRIRAGFRVCAVFYGHPGVFVYPSHEAIRRRGWFDPGAVGRLVELDRGGRVDGAYSLFSILCIELWARSFLDGNAARA